jgi:hypothetical protein
MIHQDCDGAVILGPCHPAGVVLAGNESTLFIASMAVAVMGWAAEDTDLTGFFKPAHDAVIGDIAKQEVAAVSKPDRAFSPAETGGQALDRRVAEAVFRKAWIKHLNGRVRIPHRG